MPRVYCEASNFVKNFCVYASTSALIVFHLNPILGVKQKKSECARYDVNFTVKKHYRPYFTIDQFPSDLTTRLAWLCS